MSKPSAAPPVPMVSREWSASDLSRGVKASAAIAGIDIALLSTDELIKRLQDIYIALLGVFKRNCHCPIELTDLGMHIIYVSIYKYTHMVCIYDVENICVIYVCIVVHAQVILT
jgi:hypothetical protein